MSVFEKYLFVKERINECAIKCGRNPSDIALVAVSKNFHWEHVFPAYKAGCRNFGENRVQEALLKIPQAPDDVHWHMIGNLQENKVKKAIGKFVLIHSVDSLELAKKISRHSQEADIVTSILLQANTSGEETKQGLDAEGWKKVFEDLIILPALNIKGLMTMAPFTEDEKKIRNCFAGLRTLRDSLSTMGGNHVNLDHLSMGMSHDYPLAIAEGATILRIGSAIFS